MITYIAIGVITLLILNVVREDVLNAYGKKDFSELFSIILFILFVAGCMGGALTAFPQMWYRLENTQYSEKIKEVVYSINIISIRNSDKTSGSFFLGCGSIDSTEYYVYFKQYEDGGVKRGMVTTSTATIYEKDEIPRIEWTEVTKKVPWLLRFGFDWADISEAREGDYRIIVPEGTIIEKFEIK